MQRCRTRAPSSAWSFRLLPAASAAPYAQSTSGGAAIAAREQSPSHTKPPTTSPTDAASDRYVPTSTSDVSAIEPNQSVPSPPTASAAAAARLSLRPVQPTAPTTSVVGMKNNSAY